MFKVALKVCATCEATVGVLCREGPNGTTLPATMGLYILQMNILVESKRSTEPPKSMKAQIPIIKFEIH